MLLATLVIVSVSVLWTQYTHPGIRNLAGVKLLLRNAADEMTLVLTDVEGTQALSQWNPGVSLPDARRTQPVIVLLSQLKRYTGLLVWPPHMHEAFSELYSPNISVLLTRYAPKSTYRTMFFVS